ncbi:MULTISPECIES: hypothetical protein [unclassified Streptomyces]|uniref:hypothetical protein n=1 Tax=unclassified Streptomyces TaxID=2593676 RepID=UPI000934A83F|nr:hypothetical protein [Streptomyces sp. NBRC 110465]
MRDTTRPGPAGPASEAPAPRTQVPPAERPGGEEWVRAFRDGPFSQALSLAIRNSGLTLERLRYRLQRQGVRASTTALSYWQRGENQPERPESLQAVVALEKILGLPSGALLALIGPPRPRGPHLRHSPGSLSTRQVWDHPAAFVAVLAMIDATPLDLHAFVPLSAYHAALVDAERCHAGIVRHRTLRATRDGVRRLVVALHEPELRSSPRVTDTQACRPGRQRFDADSGFMAYELLLDRELRAGQCIRVAHTVRFPPGVRSTVADLRVRTSPPELVQEVVFDPSMLPARVLYFHRAKVSASREETNELYPGVSGVVQHVAASPVPGIHGIRWQWG